MALQNNELADESDLFVYSDGPKNKMELDKVNEVRNYIKTIKGFNKITIVEHENNRGLAATIIDGVTKIVNNYGKIIVLEDDMVTSPFFLRFINDSLVIYENEKEVGMIHGHIYNIPKLPELFFMYKAGCLGWGTWSDRWNGISFDGKKLLAEIKRRKLIRKFDVNGSFPYTKMLKDQIKGKNNSWAIRLYASFLLNGKLTFYPGESFVQHIGYDVGTHCGNASCPSDMDGFITKKRVEAKKIEILDSKDALLKLEQFYNSRRIPLIMHIILKLKRETRKMLRIFKKAKDYSGERP